MTINVLKKVKSLFVWFVDFIVEWRILHLAEDKNFAIIWDIHYNFILQLCKVKTTHLLGKTLLIA